MLPRSFLGQMATPENTAVLREKLGLDKHPVEQYLVWLSNVAMGDLGISKAGLGAGLGTPIVEMLGPRIDNTAMLTVLVGVIAIPISVALGLLAAMHPGTRLDRTITFSTLNIISIPDFLIATILVLVFAVSLGWLPSIVYLRGDESGWVLMKTIAMPLMTLVILVLFPDYSNDASHGAERHEFALRRDGDFKRRSSSPDYSPARTF